MASDKTDDRGSRVTETQRRFNETVRNLLTHAAKASR